MVSFVWLFSLQVRVDRKAFAGVLIDKLTVGGKPALGPFTDALTRESA
jgi:hypothetical protein